MRDEIGRQRITCYEQSERVHRRLIQGVLGKLEQLARVAIMEKVRQLVECNERPDTFYIAGRVQL